MCDHYGNWTINDTNFVVRSQKKPIIIGKLWGATTVVELSSDDKKICTDNGWDRRLILKKGYTEQEYREFEDQDLIIGIIWYEDGSCKEYDGNKWQERTCPPIPEECGGEDSNIKSAGKR